ncbi:alpha/beta-Hydrolases superfamily protein [Wolffia australiana]
MEQLVNFIIRPPRAVYSPEIDLLEEEFILKGRRFRRKDLQVKNNRGNVLQCSHYLPYSIPEGILLPCVIYCHGNSGCRADASEAAVILLPSNITVFALDFSGSGLSEGEHVTLGWNEKEDLLAVVDYLRKEGNVSLIGLWGRSMGAVTSLMYGAEDPSVAGIVLDSPFSNLVDLMMELVDNYKYRLPKFTVKLAIQHMRRIIKKKTNFDIMALDALQVAKSCFVPALLGHATDDDFIRPHHSDLIYDAYVGDKNIIKFDGDHNSPRPQFYFDSITIFFHNVLNPPIYEIREDYHQTVVDYIDQDNWEEVIALDCQDEGPTQLPSVSGTNNSAAGINRVRIRRPMSRMEVPEDSSLLKLSQDLENGYENGVGKSSSGLRDLDLSNGPPHGKADDRFLAYSFDTLSDMAYTMEEEERMLMEAVMESLRDLEIQHLKEQHPLAEGSSDSSSDPSNEREATSSECPSEIRANQSLPSGTDQESSMPPTAANSSNITHQNKLRDGSMNPSCSLPEHNDDDISARTQATIIVQRNSLGNPFEGLMQRFGSIFKNHK